MQQKTINPDDPSYQESRSLFQQELINQALSEAYRVMDRVMKESLDIDMSCEIQEALSEDFCAYDIIKPNHTNTLPHFDHVDELPRIITNRMIMR